MVQKRSDSIFVSSVQENPPSKEGLSSDDCERIIISLLLESIIHTDPKWTAYEYVSFEALKSLHLEFYSQSFSQY